MCIVPSGLHNHEAPHDQHPIAAKGSCCQTKNFVSRGLRLKAAPFVQTPVGPSHGTYIIYISYKLRYLVWLHNYSRYK